MTVADVNVDGLAAAIRAALQASRKVDRALERLESWCDQTSGKSESAAEEADVVAQRILNFQAILLDEVSEAIDVSALFGMSPLGDLDGAAAGARTGLEAFAEAARTAAGNLRLALETVQHVRVWLDVVKRQLQANWRSAGELKKDPGLRSAIERCSALAEALRSLIDEAPSAVRLAGSGSEWGQLADDSVSLLHALRAAAETAESLNAALRAISGT